MTRFSYKALAPSGEIRRGEIDAENESAAIDALRTQNFTPLKLNVSSGLLQRGRGGKALQNRELIELFSGLETLGSSTLALDHALDLIADTQSRARLARLARDLAERLRAGDGLSEAFAEAAKAGAPALPPVTAAILRAGEQAGDLDGAFLQIAQMAARTEESRKRLRDALAYPIFIIIAAAGALVFLAKVVAPSFIPLFEAQNVTPPDLLITMMAVGNAAPWALLILMIAGLAAARPPSEGLKRARDQFLLAAPGMRGVVTRLETARFTLALGTLLGSGTRLLAALPIARDVVGNAVMRDQLDAATEQVRAGRSIASALSGVPAFPPIARRMLPLAEAGGSLTETLQRVSGICETEARDQVDRVLRVLAPVLIIAVGALVAVVVTILFTSILDLNEAVF